MTEIDKRAVASAEKDLAGGGPSLRPPELAQPPLTQASPQVHAPLDSLALEEAYVRAFRELDGDMPSRLAGDEYLLTTNGLYHGGPLAWSFVPKIFSVRDTSYLAWIAETMGRIMDKLTRRYLEDASLRALFRFDPVLEAATTSPVPYEQLIPIARVDIFLDERTGDFKFCELNTDGSSGMLSTQEVTRAAAMSATARRFSRGRALYAYDTVGACADTVLACYRETPGAKERPAIAAVDYKESIAAEEMDEFTGAFAERGCDFRVADVRELTYENGVLADSQGPIDCVWRRVVISELLDKACPGADALMRAATEGRVPLVGAMRTWPTATKTVFAVLHSPVAKEFLDADELEFVRRHVPATYLVDEKSDMARFRDREAWIAKPRDGYNSMGVTAGADCSDEEWERVLDEVRRVGGVVQEYVRPFATENLPGGAAGADADLAPYMNMEGLFLFNGAFAGVFTRCGTNAVIGEFTGRLNMPILVVDDADVEALAAGGE